MNVFRDRQEMSKHVMSPDFFPPMVSDRFGGVMCSEEEIGLHRWLSYIYLLGVLKRCVLGENFWTELAAGKKDFSVRMQN